MNQPHETDHWAPGTFAFIEYGDCRHAIAAVKYLHGRFLEERIIECELTTREMNLDARGVYCDEELFRKIEQETAAWAGFVPNEEPIFKESHDDSVAV